MAYGDITYRSNFYSVKGTFCSVKIYKDGYSGATTEVRTQSVSILVNYLGEDVPLIGTGATVTIINDGDFSDFNDLLTSHEKQFKVVIEYDSAIVFEGFLLNDLNEQQFLPFGLVTIQCANYLRRLEDDHLDALANISLNKRMLPTIQEALASTGLNYDLYVNSTLFEENMEDDDTDTWLHQTWVENALFYKNPDEYDDTYKVLNKMLLPFGAFLYMSGQKWIVERLDNVNRVGDWVRYESSGGSPLVGIAAGTLRQVLNKQDGDFIYIESSQIIEYQSAYKELLLRLNELAYTTLIFNNLTAATVTPTAAEIPAAGSLSKRTWYINDQNTDLADGNNYGDITRYFYWKGGTAVAWRLRGLYYVIDIQNNLFNDPIEMFLNYKINHGFSSTMTTVRPRYTIRINSGIHAGKYLDNSGDHLALNAAEYIFGPMIQTPSENLITMTEVLDLTPIFVDLGNPTSIDFIISFLPSYWLSNLDEHWYYTQENYIGDFEVIVTPNAIDNEISTVLADDFIKTKEMKLDLFDLDDHSYVNGLLCYLGTKKTSAWDSEGDSAYTETLIDILIKNQFRKYSETVHRLKARIMYEGYLKPLAVISDDNLALEESDGTIVDFIVMKHNWDLVNDIYAIVAEEYPDTEITIN